MLNLVMAITQADIDSLNAAIASGERQVTIGGTSVTYQTVASLIQARDDMRREFMRQEAAAAGAKRRPRITRLFYAGRE